MVTIVNTHEAKTHFSRLIQRALDGEEIIIARAGKPLVKLTPIEMQPKKPFPFGIMKGDIWVAEDFNDPLPDDLLDLFEGADEQAEDFS